MEVAAVEAVLEDVDKIRILFKNSRVHYRINYFFGYLIVYFLAMAFA